VTVRRLRDDVEEALALAETDPEAFGRTGGLPGEAEREIGATATEREGIPSEAEPGCWVPGNDIREDQARGDREIGAAVTGGEGGLAGGNPAGRTLIGGDREIGATVMGREGRPSEAEPGFGVPRNDTGEDGARGDRETGAAATGGGGDLAGGHWGTDASDILGDYRHPEPLKSAPHETCWARFIGPADIVLLFKAVLCTVRRRLERETGRLPTEGQALGAMLDHCFEAWGAFDEKLARRYKVFARDGWRCAAPGCTSMQNLHDHHIRFRSAQGPDALENRITLCAFHHLRGVHGGLLRCIGRAPDGLRWELGIRPRVTPRLAYRSGDIRAPATALAAAVGS
jgi:hypothetical protein